jgi:hypothetical protein
MKKLKTVAHTNACMQAVICIACNDGGIPMKSYSNIDKRRGRYGHGYVGFCNGAQRIKMAGSLRENDKFCQSGWRMMGMIFCTLQEVNAYCVQHNGKDTP